MPTRSVPLEQTEYRLVMVLPYQEKILANYNGSAYCLPHISVPKYGRPTEELQQAIKEAWNLLVIILDFAPSVRASSACVIAQVLPAHNLGVMVPTSLDQLSESELEPSEHILVGEILGGCGKRGPFSRIGWIDEAVEWVFSVLATSDSSIRAIRQYNASSNFALVRFLMRDGSAYWMKATGAPNAHELDVTVTLSTFVPEFLPPLIDVRHDWNAWIAAEAGQCLMATSEMSAFESAAVSLAALQKRAIGLRSNLLACGARDQSISVLHEHCLEMVDYLHEAMSRQTSTKAAPLEHQRLAEIGSLLQNACFKMDALSIPDTVIHGDMNRGNILLDGSRCRFIDWSEAYLGNPFLNFQHLSLLNRGEHKEENAVRMKHAYRCSWLELLEPMQIDTAFALSPLLAVASYLYGRGDWLRSSRRNDPALGNYACILARHMDRAASAPELKEVLCR